MFIGCNVSSPLIEDIWNHFALSLNKKLRIPLCTNDSSSVDFFQTMKKFSFAILTSNTHYSGLIADIVVAFGIFSNELN